jgi:hypothetical protein
MKMLLLMLAICGFSGIAHAKSYKLKGDAHVDGFAYKMHHLASGKLKITKDGVKSFNLKIENFHGAKVIALMPKMIADLSNDYTQLIFEGRHQMKSRNMVNGNMMSITVVCILPKKKTLNLNQVDFTTPVVSGKDIFNGCTFESTYATGPRHSNHWFKVYGSLNL